MKNIAYTAIIAILFSSSAWGQLIINPNPAIISEVDITEFDVVAYTSITNESDVPRTLRWERNVISIADGWQSAVCDKVQCYLPHVSSQTFPMDGNETANLDVHVYPANKEGAAIIEITVTDVQDESVTVTGQFYFNEDPNSSFERISNKIKIFPNPTQDFLFIEDFHSVAQLDIFSLQGQLLLSSPLSSPSLSIAHLPQGTYVVRMRNAAGKEISTNVLKKI
jgi:hypothetical protein